MGNGSASTLGNELTEIVTKLKCANILVLECLFPEPQQEIQ